jgi:2-polyprenyl-3-methyl-5-hydroxy-6-metoxy-1,4-benzoquinol methylase
MSESAVVPRGADSGGAAAVGCPVCRCPCSSTPLYTYTPVEAATHFCPLTRNRARHEQLTSCIRQLWNGDDCKILKCEACGFAFGYPFVGGNEEFYRLLHDSSGYPGWKWDFDIGMGELAACPSGGQMLDIGAGGGAFLQRLPKRWKRCATEGSPITRKVLRDKGITVFEDLREALRDQAGAFQMITLYQVLEHLSNFNETLTDCRRLLAPDGKVVIVVPHGDAMIRQERVTGCADMPPNHICKWTPNSLATALRNAGLRAFKTVDEPASLKNVASLVHLRLRADACDHRSAAAQVYRIGDKKTRIVLFAALGLGALVRMLPHFRDWPLSGAFATVAVREA